MVGTHETGRVRGGEPSERARESSTAGAAAHRGAGARPCVGREPGEARTHRGGFGAMAGGRRLQHGAHKRATPAGRGRTSGDTLGAGLASCGAAGRGRAR